jgi:hypothetical protein
MLEARTGPMPSGHDRFVADRHDDIHFRIDEFAGEA